MTNFSCLLIPLLSILSIFSLSADAPVNENSIMTESIQFTPPSGWRNADQAALPNQVQLMIIGKGASEFPPSISLATETYSGTVKQYLKIIKDLNASKGHEWKDLGTISTEAGNASLSQTDSKSQWGNIRMMHVIIKKKGTVFIITAAALKEEFPKFYKEIFAALRSLRFASNNE